MARLIDAQDAFNVLTDYYHHSTHVQHLALQEALNKVPTVDAEPVIWCSECYFWDKEPSQTAMPEVHTCRYWRIGTTSIDYCARASRDGWLKAIPKDSRKDSIDEEIERAWEYAETD